MSLAVVFNGRRKTVKVTPNTTMQAVLEMACAEHDIKDSSGYCLMHKKSAIDPSQPFRFTGIPNNATVDLVEQKGRVEQKVRLAVQVAGGRRVQGNYDPSVSLWDVIGQAVADGQLDRAYLEQESVVVYLRQSFQGQATLTETTLRSMGLVSGSALLNLRLASGEAPGGQASVPAPASSASTDSGVEESKFSTQRPVPPPPAMAAMPPPAPVNMDVATDVAPPPPRPAPPTATPMSVCSSGQSTPMEVAEPPTMGYSAAQDALETMQTRCFESDLKETVALLAKYIDNIVGKPNEPKTRAIKCSNAHFQQKVAPRPGGRDFLMALGFKEEQRGLTHEIAKDPLGHTFLVLSPEAEDTSLLLRARRLLYDAALTMELDIGPPPDPTRARAASAPQQNFDPYRSVVTSMSMQLPRDQGPSLTEIKLNELKQKQMAIQAELPERGIQVILPGTVVPSAPVVTLPDTEDAAPGDMAQVAKSLAHKMAMRKREEDAPFRTKAQRELESLERAKVYSHTALRIQLPDRTIVLAKFHPRETVGDVRRLLVDEVFSPVGQARAFTLYVSPPRRVLQDSVVLQEEGMVPAALVYLSWDESGPTPSSEPFLRPEFVASSSSSSEGGGGAAVAATEAAAMYYPKGVDLVEKKSKADAEAEAKALMGGKREGDKEGGGGTGKKPAWLKLK